MHNCIGLYSIDLFTMKRKVVTRFYKKNVNDIKPEMKDWVFFKRVFLLYVHLYQKFYIFMLCSAICCVKNVDLQIITTDDCF